MTRNTLIFGTTCVSTWGFEKNWPSDVDGKGSQWPCDPRMDKPCHDWLCNKTTRWRESSSFGLMCVPVLWTISGQVVLILFVFLGLYVFQPPTLGFDRFLWFFLKHAWAVRLHWQDACCALLGAQWTVQEGSHSRTRGYFIWYWLQVLQKVYHPLQGCYQARLVWGNLG